MFPTYRSSSTTCVLAARCGVKGEVWGWGECNQGERDCRNWRMCVTDETQTHLLNKQLNLQILQLCSLESVLLLQCFRELRCECQDTSRSLLYLAHGQRKEEREASLREGCCTGLVHAPTCAFKVSISASFSSRLSAERQVIFCSSYSAALDKRGAQ